MIEACDGTWDQEVGQLHLEELRLLVHNEQCAIHRLDNHHGGLVWPKIAHQEVEGVALQRALVDFLVLRKGLVVHDHANRELAAVQNCNCHCPGRISSIQELLRDFCAHQIGLAVNLENRRP